jgi:hypothetical protein
MGGLAFITKGVCLSLFVPVLKGRLPKEQKASAETDCSDQAREGNAAHTRAAGGVGSDVCSGGADQCNLVGRTGSRVSSSSL